MFLFWLCASGAWALEPWDALPAPNAVAGWSRTDRITSYISCTIRQVSVPESLFKAINGGAPVYTQRGFVNGVFAGYYYPDSADTFTACIEIYNQGFMDSALSVYAYRGSNIQDSIILSIPGAARTRRNLGYDYNYYYEMVAGIFYVKVSTQRQFSPCSTAAINFLTYIAQRAAPVEHFAIPAGIFKRGNGYRAFLCSGKPASCGVPRALVDIRGRPAVRNRSIGSLPHGIYFGRMD